MYEVDLPLDPERDSRRSRFTGGSPGRTPFTGSGPVGMAMTGLAASTAARKESVFILRRIFDNRFGQNRQAEGLANKKKSW
jgi:hypothetical protein